MGVHLHGANLGTGVTSWNGDFATTLAGTTVTINNKLAYLLLHCAKPD